MPDLDIYRDWLKIADTNRPLNYYQLLKLEKFEDDAAKIRKNYRQLNAHVRKYAAGNYAKLSQDLLNELAKAMLCLTDAKRKREYDTTQGRVDKKSDRKRTLEDLLLARQLVDQAKLKKARDFADAVGLEVRDALVQQKMVEPDVLMQLYAESIGLPYIELDEVGVDESLIPKFPAVLARQHSCAPVMMDDGQMLVVSPNPLTPEVEEELRLRTGFQVRCVLCMPQSINTVIEKHYSREKAAREMAAMGANKPAPTAPTADGSSKPAKPATPPDELLKIRVIAAFIPFGACLIGGQLVMNWSVFKAGGLGVLLAGITYGIMMVVKK